VKQNRIKVGMAKNFARVARIKQQRERLVRSTKDAIWDEEHPFELNQADWIGSTAHRYSEKRERAFVNLKEKLQATFQQVHGKEAKVLLIHPGMQHHPGIVE